MNDACSLMQKRLEEKYLPALVDCTPVASRVWKQEVSGNEGTLYELDLGKFTQEELVLVYELCVGCYYILNK